MRNRAKEIVNLLEDNNMIAQERRKAKENRNKYIGVGSQGASSYGNYDSYDSSPSNSHRYEESYSEESGWNNAVKETVNAAPSNNSFKNDVASNESSLLNLTDDLVSVKNSKTDDDFTDFQSATVSVPASKDVKKTISSSQDLFGEFETPSVQSNSFAPKPSIQTSFFDSSINANSVSPVKSSNQATNNQTNFTGFANFEAISKPSPKKAPVENSLNDFITKNSNLVSLEFGNNSIKNPTQPTLSTLQKSKLNS